MTSSLQGKLFTHWAKDSLVSLLFEYKLSSCHFLFCVALHIRHKFYCFVFIFSFLVGFFFWLINYLEILSLTFHAFVKVFLLLTFSFIPLWWEEIFWIASRWGAFSLNVVVCSGGLSCVHCIGLVGSMFLRVFSSLVTITLWGGSSNILSLRFDTMHWSHSQPYWDAHGLDTFSISLSTCH